MTFQPDRAAILRLLEDPDGPVAKAIEREAVAVERRAKRLCPVDTGRLRASITHRTGRDQRGIVGIIGTNVNYAVFVEMGTRYQQARSFLRAGLRSRVG